MRSLFVALAILLTVLIGNAGAEPPPRKPADAAAVNHYTRGARLYGNAAFAEAIEEFKASALVEPAPATEFNLGVCYRLLGEAAADPTTKKERFNLAIWHYVRFINTSPETPERKSEVQKLIDTMRSEIAAMPTQPPSSTTPVPEPLAPALPDPFYRDPVAWVVTGSGVAVLGVSAGLFLSASSLRDDADANPDQKMQTSLRDRAHTRSLVGTTLAIVGGGLLVTGVIKLVVHDTEPTRTRSSLGLGVSRHGLIMFGTF